MNIKERFIIRYAPDAIKAGMACDFRPDILLAQAALETGWGQHVVANNLFGIKDLPWDEGNVQAITKEHDGSHLIKVIAKFEDFKTPLESMIAYIALIRTAPRYRKAWHNRHDPICYFHALQDAGYATDPFYANKCIAVWKSLPKNWLEIAARAKIRGEVKKEGERYEG